jgi:hypothetical protein
MNLTSEERKNKARADLSALYSWPDHLRDLATPLHDLASRIDLQHLARVAADVHRYREVTFAIVSREYLRIGRNWVHAMRKAALTNFFILSGDPETAATFDGMGVPNVLAGIDESSFDPNFISTTGFTAKGLAVSAFKFPVTAFLAKAGYHVVMSDADAIWLADVAPHVRGADIAFQRIVYHPPELTSLWGFAACGGFISARATPKAAAFIDHCIQEQKTIFCDQISINLALLAHDPAWQCDLPGWSIPSPDILIDQTRREAFFAQTVSRPIVGVLARSRGIVLALAHDKFWRHPWVAADRQTMVVCHPNSPKDDQEKIALLRSLDLEIDPAIQD